MLQVQPQEFGISGTAGVEGLKQGSTSAIAFQSAVHIADVGSLHVALKIAEPESDVGRLAEAFALPDETGVTTTVWIFAVSLPVFFICMLRDPLVRVADEMLMFAEVWSLKPTHQLPWRCVCAPT